MPAEHTCPCCGTALAADALEGLCPTCVGRAAFASEMAGDAVEAALSPEIKAEFARLKPEEVGERIGQYKLMEQIGQGGFGTVWVADQERPVRRRVALKIIKLGMDTKEVIARFEQERQALAMMDHPHIAKVLDAGATQWGRPYFVMELVRGIKITEYCDQANLPTAERLALFIQVCNAVQHAHQKGIIHRDLKPSNILVTLHDGVPVPKVIDFGVAKATQQVRLTDLTIYTQFQQMIGTPLYMSPEQAEMSGLDVDTRSDIYSLGVLLYELLVGRTPFDPETLMRAGLDEIRRVIREEEPPKPSTALQTMAADARASVAQHRQTDGAKMARLLSGELDWIVMKALEKDRVRRYETASGFAEDVQRHLQCEPVVARRAGRLYRFRKFARRKPAVTALVGVSGLAVLALIGALVAQVAFHSEQAQRKKVEVALQDAERARKAEEAQRKQKEAALVEAERARQAEAEARGEEAKQRHIADAALANAERNGYFRRIAFAHREWEASDVTSAEQLLDECPADLRSWEWHYLKRLCHSELLTLRGFANGVQSVAVTTNGRYVAAVSADGVLKVWDATTGLEDLAFGGRQQGIASVAFNPSGTQLAMGNSDGVVELWAMRTAAKSWSAKGHAGAVKCLVYSADGRSLVSGGADGTIRVWNGDTGELLQAPLNHGEPINSVTISSDGKLIASASGVPESVTTNGERVPEQPGTIKVWEASTGQLNFTLDKVGVVYSLVFSPDGRSLASGHSEGTVKLWGVRDAVGTLWDVNTGSLQESTFRGHLGEVFSVAFSADGSRLVSGSADRTVKVWMLSKKGESVTYRGHKGAVHGVAFTGDGRRAVSASADGTVKLWDVSRFQEVSALEDDGRTLAFNPNGEVLVSGRNVWNVAALKGEFQLGSSTKAVDYGRVAFSPDGKLLAKSRSFARDSMSVWNTETHQIVTTIEQGHDYEVAFSPDGKLIASCIASGRSRIVKMWEATTGVEVHSFVITTDVASNLGVWDLAFSRDGELLALAIGDWQHSGLRGAGEPGEVQIWEWKTPRLVRTLRARRFCVWSVAFSPDGKRVASAGGLYMTGDPQARAVVNPGEVQVWDVESGEEIFNLNVPDNAFSVAFSPDGKRLVAACGKLKGIKVPREVKIWDMETGLVAFTLRGFDREVFGVAFSPDGKRIATVGGGTLKVFNAEKTEFDALPGLNRAYEHYSEVIVETKASPKARANALLNRSQVLRHLNRPAEAEADSRQFEFLLAEERLRAGLEREAFAYLARACEYDPLSTLAAATAAAALNTWQHLLPATILAGHDGGVKSAQFSPDGARIVTASDDKTARVWDAATGQSLATLAGHGGGVKRAQFSPDGSRIVTASDDKTAWVWDAATGQSLVTLTGHKDGVASAQFSPDGARIVTASDDRTARVWDAATGKILATLAGHEAYVLSAQFSPDGSRIVTASGDKTARVWDAATGKSLVTLTGHKESVTSAQFSPDGAHIVTASWDKTARVSDAATGQSLATLAGHENYVWSAQFSPDGSRIVTASADKTARVWRAATATLGGHESYMWSAQFSLDAARIVTASEDKTARIWTILPTTAGPPPAWFADFLRYLAQMHLNSDGEPETLKPDDWLALRGRMSAVRRASAGQDTPYLRILRRYVPE